MAGIFGNGSDGNVTISSDTTLTRDMCYNDLTINSGITLTSAGFRIRVAGTLLNNGVICGGYEGSGGVGGVGGTPSSNPGSNGTVSATEGNGSGGAGGGGGGDSGGTSGATGGNGGTGGRKSRSIFIATYSLNNQGIISSSGEAGGNGTNGGASNWGSYGIGGAGGGGGGGSGGNGGNLELFYFESINIGTVNYFGGIGGIGGNGGSGYVHGTGGSWGPAGGNGGNGIYGLGGSCPTYGPGSSGSSRGGGGAGGGGSSLKTAAPSANSAGGNGASGGKGEDGIKRITHITDYYGWVLTVDDYNFVSVWNNTDILKGYRCQELGYLGSGDCEVYKIIDFGKSVEGILFNINGYIKISSYVASAVVNFKYEWLDSASAVISSNSIATLTANQEYTKSYVENVTAPTGTHKVKIRFYCSGSGSVKAYLGSFSVDEVVKYGLKIKDGSNINVLTPEIGTIISCGTATMPNSLNGDGTYGLDIDLPETASIPVSKIGVFLLPHGNITWEAFGKGLGWASGDPSNSMRYIPSCFVDDDYTYYTKDSTTGVMSVFTPGTHTASTPETWDGIISIFPVVGWDRVGENLTSVRLWAATCYIIVDGLSELKAIYSIGNTGGITSVDYAIFLKEWNF
jgi:hypothetical protein